MERLSTSFFSINYKTFQVFTRTLHAPARIRGKSLAILFLALHIKNRHDTLLKKKTVDNVFLIKCQTDR